MDEQSLTVMERVKADDRLAYNLKNAAQVLDISYQSIRREIIRGKIKTTQTLKLVPRSELIRYLTEETGIHSRSKRTRFKSAKPA